MDNIFNLNPLLNSIDLKDAISERLVKIDSIANCLLTTNGTVSQPSLKTIYNIIWAICDYLAEIKLLHEQLLENEL